MSHLTGKATSHSTGATRTTAANTRRVKEVGEQKISAKLWKTVRSTALLGTPSLLPSPKNTPECSRLAAERWQQAPEPHGGTLEGGSAGSARIKKRLTEEGRCWGGKTMHRGEWNSSTRGTDRAAGPLVASPLSRDFKQHCFCCLLTQHSLHCDFSFPPIP